MYANTCDDYWWYCNKGNISDLKVGMIIAVPSHTHGYLASIYGHVCIYIGDGKVMDSAGCGEIRIKDLYEWLAYYDTNLSAPLGLVRRRAPLLKAKRDTATCNKERRGR